MKIRPETVDDHEAIGRVVSAAFDGPTEARLVELIRASPEYIADLALVADVDGDVVGHVMISRTALVGHGVRREILTLSPLAVTPDRHRLGIGTALVREVTARADTTGAPLVVLEGSPHYYPRFGFEPAADHGIDIELPDWAQPEAAQVLRLAAYDAACRGRVEYPPAFAEVAEH